MLTQPFAITFISVAVLVLCHYWPIRADSTLHPEEPVWSNTGSSWCFYLHNAWVDGDNSSLQNQGCQASCMLHDRHYVHAINEGRHCPGALASSNATCQKGQCMPAVDSIGSIDCHVLAADLSAPAVVTVYTDVRNSSLGGEKKGWMICQTLVSWGTEKPDSHHEWGTLCEDSVHFTFDRRANLTFTLYDMGLNVTRPDSPRNDTLIGQVYILMSEIMDRGDNNQPITLPLEPVGPNLFRNDSITIRATWTPRVY